MERPTPSAPPLISQRRERRSFWLVVGIAVTLVVLFEVGIRHLPPDGMTVTYSCSNCGYPFSLQTMDEYYAWLNDAPVYPEWPPRYHTCLPVVYPSVVFRWHGIPVESWTSVGCGNYIESAGGISDTMMFVSH